LSLQEPFHTVVEVQIAPVLVEPEREDIGSIDPLLVRRLEATAAAALRHEGQSGELALVLTDDQSIQELNRDFLGEDTPTDVLSFSALEEAGPFVTAPEAGGYLGDVIISYPRAVQQAREQGHAVELELDLLVVHGILHLLGYDHATVEEKALMWSHQESILSGLRP
jgi:probable rRNA maturation factor